MRAGINIFRVSGWSSLGHYGTISPIQRRIDKVGVRFNFRSRDHSANPTAVSLSQSPVLSFEAQRGQIHEPLMRPEPVDRGLAYKHA